MFENSMSPRRTQQRNKQRANTPSNLKITESIQPETPTPAVEVNWPEIKNPNPERLFNVYLICFSRIPLDTDLYQMLDEAGFLKGRSLNMCSLRQKDCIKAAVAIIVNPYTDLSYRNKKTNPVVRKAMISRLKYHSYSITLDGVDINQTYGVGCKWVKHCMDCYREGFGTDKIRDTFDVKQLFK